MAEVENLLVPADEDICSMTEIDEAGREWICIRKPHGRVYRNREAGGIYQHYMVNRWPYRDLPDGTTI